MISCSRSKNLWRSLA